MEPRISIVTLGVDDLDRATAFYEAMGLKRHQRFTDGVAFFQLGGVILSLFPREDLARDAGIEMGPAAASSLALAHNTRSAAEVDAVLDAATQAGGRIVKPATTAFWGGRSVYFADPEGHLWEVAHNPDFPIDEEGRISLPA